MSFMSWGDGYWRVNDGHHCAGTGGLNVPMFIALRRFTLFCTIILERFMMQKKHDRSTLGAVGVMIGGTANFSSCTMKSCRFACHTTLVQWQCEVNRMDCV